jgi:uronate dehydrogenase
LPDVEALTLQKDEGGGFPEPSVARDGVVEAASKVEEELMRRVLITGAGGGIGRSLRETLRGVYPILRLSDRVALAPAREGEEVDRTELSDMPAVERMVAGVDGIVHLGGISGENEWPVILEGNIIGIYNVFEAARRAGVQRIVFATSNHAVGFYPREQKIDHGVVPRPDSRYGVSKAFGEALASLYSDKHGIGVLCTRIGNFGEKPIDKRRLSIWISPRDYTQLVRIGLDHPDLRYEIVYGVSNNRRSWYDNSNAARLGYRPQDDSEPYAEAVLAAEAGQPADPIAEHYQGGTFCAAEYTAKTPRP